MYVREYKRGHEVRTVPIQNPEAVAVLSSLIGETQAAPRRKACFSTGASTFSRPCTTPHARLINDSHPDVL